MLCSILVRASSSTSSRNTTSPLRVFMPRTRPKGTCWHLKTEETLSSNKKYKCKQTIATCLPRNVPKCATAGTAGWSGSTGFCPSWKEIKSNINVILARKIYVAITDQQLGSRHLSCGRFISVYSPHKSSHQNRICSSCRWLQQYLWNGTGHIIPSLLLKFSHLLEDWASQSKPGDVETGSIAAEQRTDIAHVSIGGKIHDAGSFPVNVHSLPSTSNQQAPEFSNLK